MTRLGDPSTGIAGVDVTVAWALGVSAVCVALGILWRIMRAMVRVAKRVEQAWEEFAGAPARPGVPAKAGLVERVGVLETRLSGIERLLGWMVARFPEGRGAGDRPPDEGALTVRVG